MDESKGVSLDHSVGGKWGLQLIWRDQRRHKRAMSPPPGDPSAATLSVGEGDAVGEPVGGFDKGGDGVKEAEPVGPEVAYGGAGYLRHRHVSGND
ncbi:hypothetical protein M569_17731 [Genlisea aurea]|uniref:Uncharacterized protein n=1 Tax=Genlisea aurea TaxID=192259 RepID=S8BRQ5_9LAMI|nr:hypothetical protein M569_17731 [Genlisea aurea]